MARELHHQVDVGPPHGPTENRGALFLQIVEALPFQLAVLDTAGRIVATNRAWDEFGRQHAADHNTIGVGVNYLEVCRGAAEHSPESNGLAEGIEAVLQGRRANFTFEYPCHSPLQERWFELLAFTMDGLPGAVICHIDVTPRKQAENARERLESQLQQSQKLEALGAMATGIAHDFNNMLTAIIGYNELAQTLVGDNEDLVEVLKGIDQVCGQAIGVTRSLLAFSGKARHTKSPIDIVQFVEHAVATLRALLPDSIEIVREMPASHDLWVEANSGGLQQVLIDLASNARDAMPDGGHLRIAVQACKLTDGAESPGREIDAVRLIVEDDGPGIPREVGERIFEPYFSTKPRGKATGLGLAAVHGIIADHGGQVHVGSAEGRGTRVTVTLPRSQPIRLVTDEPVPAASRGRGQIVILAEDEPQVQEVICTALRSSLYQVVVASDGDEAIRAFHAYMNRIELVILDIDLPKRDGVSCMRAIRADAPEMPVVMISGLLELHQRDDFPQDVAFLPKPFKMADVVALVGDMLNTPVKA